MRRPIFQFIYVNHRHGGETVVAVQGKRIICPDCSGTGAVLCEGLRGQAIDQEAFDEDPDFKADYFGGKYDVRCERCDGNRVVVDIDEDRLSDSQRRVWRSHLAHLAQQAALDASDRRQRMMENGGYRG